MPAYRYSAQDVSGLLVSGVLEADTARLARSALREKKLYPVQVDAVGREEVSRGKAPSIAQFGRWRRGLSSAQLSLMTRQFATLLSASLTVEKALSALIDQTENELTRQILAGVRSEVLSGSTLHRALGLYPATFPDIYRALVGAGEQSGELDQVMLKLADYTESKQGLQQRLILAFIYPAIVSLVAFLVIVGLMTYVVPQIVGVFQRTHQALPLLTRLLIGLSNFLLAWGPYLLVIAAGLGYAFQQGLNNPVRRRNWHQLILKMPVIGRLTRNLGSARFASTLAILVSSGVPLLAALRTGADVMGNLVMKQTVENAANLVREGGSLSRSLARDEVFPPVLIHLIASGESSGRLDYMLEKAAVQQESEVTNRIALLTGMLEPLLIVIMGGVVLLIVLAILLPIINVNQLVR